MRGKRLLAFINTWRDVLMFLCCASLWNCADPIDYYQPFYGIEEAGRCVQLDFNVAMAGNYQFSLLFGAASAEKYPEELPWQTAVLGNSTVPGTRLPLSLRLIKDGRVFLEENIDNGHTFDEYIFLRRDGKRRTRTLERPVTMLALPAGRYTAVITTRRSVTAFEDVSAYARVIAFTPKNVVRIAQQQQEIKKRWDSKWYHILNTTKWVVKEIGCLAFDCPVFSTIYQPIDVSKAGQSASIEFDISKTWDYQFFLTFELGWENKERARRRHVIAESIFNKNREGIPIPVSLKIVKDGKVFYHKTITTSGAQYLYQFNYKGKEIDSLERIIRTLELPPGHYSAEVMTQQDIAEFHGIFTLIKIKFFSLKI